MGYFLGIFKILRKVSWLISFQINYSENVISKAVYFSVQYNLSKLLLTFRFLYQGGDTIERDHIHQIRVWISCYKLISFLGVAFVMYLLVFQSGMLRIWIKEMTSYQTTHTENLICCLGKRIFSSLVRNRWDCFKTNHFDVCGGGRTWNGKSIYLKSSPQELLRK